MPLLTLASVGLALSAQLAAARAEIDMSGPSARVEARYQIASGPARVRFVLMQVEGQRIQMLDGHRLTPTRGLYELVTDGGDTTVTVRYEVTGALERIPLFVPDVPTNPGVSQVSIRVRGLAPTTAIADGFPRFTADGDSAVVARPENVPSFILLRPRSALSTNRLADAFVALLVVGATAFWVYRRRRWRTATRTNAS